MSMSMSQKEKSDIINKVWSGIILCLGDKTLRVVTKEKIIVLMWVKLESLYMIKSLAHILCLKEQFYSFRMIELRTMVE